MSAEQITEIKETLQDEVVDYFKSYESNIPFTYTDEQQQTFIDDICDLIVCVCNKAIN